MSRRRSCPTRSALALAAAWLLLSGCGPGVATPMPEPPQFDLSGVNKDTVTPATNPADPQALVITGVRGTVPAGAVVRVTNLDRTDAVAAANAAPNGSFEVVIAALDGQELRFEWTNGNESSAPADAIVHRPDPASLAYQLQPSPRFDCLKLAPGFVLDFSNMASATLNLTNGCAQTVSLGNPATRLGLTDFALTTALPVDVPAGRSSKLSVGFARGAAGLREDILFVDASQGSTTIRYPITLRAE